MGRLCTPRQHIWRGGREGGREGASHVHSCSPSSPVLDIKSWNCGEVKPCHGSSLYSFPKAHFLRLVQEVMPWMLLPVLLLGREWREGGKEG
jgi:hypothetical protein